MAKFYGIVGYAVTVKDSNGVWREEFVERPYYGDVTKYSAGVKNSDKINSDINLTNNFSIVSDPYANENFMSIRYVEYLGVKWRVTDIQLEYPRILLITGGEYNA